MVVRENKHGLAITYEVAIKPVLRANFPLQPFSLGIPYLHSDLAKSS